MELDPEVKKALTTALLSGATTGAGMGAIGSYLTARGKPKMGTLGKSALIGGALYGGLSAGATGIGSGLMGAPTEEETTGFTSRAALGGALGGGAVGGGIGALVAGGKIAAPKQIPEFIGQYIANLKNAKNAKIKGAVMGAAALGLPVAYLASDEGMQTDFVNNQMKENRRREIAKLEDQIAAMRMAYRG